MIRMTYLDREYYLTPVDDASRPLLFKPSDNAAWVTVLNQGGLKIEVLTGATKSNVGRFTPTESASIEGGK